MSVNKEDTIIQEQDLSVANTTETKDTNREISHTVTLYA